MGFCFHQADYLSIVEKMIGWLKYKDALSRAMSLLVVRNRLQAILLLLDGDKFDALIWPVLIVEEQFFTSRDVTTRVDTDTMFADDLNDFRVAVWHVRMIGESNLVATTSRVHRVIIVQAE